MEGEDPPLLEGEEEVVVAAEQASCPEREGAHEEIRAGEETAMGDRRFLKSPNPCRQQTRAIDSVPG